MASAAAALLACVAVLAAAAVGAEQLPKPQTPITQNDNPFYAKQNASLAGPPRFTYGTADLPEDSPLFAKPANAGTPDQVKLTTVSPKEVWVTFTTGTASNGTYNTTAPKAPALPFGKPCVVSYGTKSGKLKDSVKSGTPHTYTQTANNGTSAKVYYISPFLYLVKLTGLKPATRYYYSIKNTATPDAPATKEFSFKTQAPVGDDSYIKIAVIGDIGETYNTSDTIQHVLGNNPDMVYNMGDLTYADHYLNNNPVKWDLWGRLVSPLFTKAPHNPTNGNHEIETSNGNNQGVSFQSYNNRYPMPYQEAGSDSQLYYSIEHGPVHVLFLSEYTDYAKSSSQYAFAAADLAGIDRSKTPWVFVIFHGPVYHTYVTHYKQYDCFRQVFEPLFNEAGVDLCMSGHVHAYERSNPVNNYTVDAAGCAPTYLTVGDGGNSEGLYHNYVNGNATDGTPGGTDGCPAPSDNDVSADPATCYSPKLQVPYCTPEQPEWSAYREDAFGHGILEIQDATTAKWSWYRNLDSKPVVTDSMVMKRDVRACPNRRQGAVLAPLPKPPKTPTRKHNQHHPKHDHFNHYEYQHKRYIKFGGKLYEWEHDHYVPCKDGKHPK